MVAKRKSYVCGLLPELTQRAPCNHSHITLYHVPVLGSILD
jgi:hypothetical protein